MAKKYFDPLPGSEVPSEHRNTFAKYRALAVDHGVEASVPLCYHVRVDGLTLKGDVPRLGPCRERFRYLQSWDFADTLTMNALVFWLPCSLSSGLARTRTEHLDLLAGIRERYGLPIHHLVNFGQAQMVAGLLLAHYLATDERLPMIGHYVRTDTVISGGLQLSLGNFGAGGLDCVYWDGFDESFDRLHFLAIGLEPLA